MKQKNQIMPVLFFLVMLAGVSTAANSTEPEMEWRIGEELIYSVKWSFISLGELRLQVLSSDSMDGRKIYHCRINIDSNPSVPFVNIHDMYDSFIDAENYYSHRFLSYEQKENHQIYTRYDFNYDQNRVRMRIEKRTEEHAETVLDSTASIDEKVQDSLSLLYFARAMSKNRVSRDIPVFAYNKLDTTQINFSGNLNKVKVHGTDVNSYFLNGRLKFVGIAGVKEDFKGWFSKDMQNVPLKAYMKAFIGSVKLEIKDWKNWNSNSLQKN